MNQPVLVLLFLAFLEICCPSLAQRISPDQVLTSDASSPSKHSHSRHGLQSETYLPPGFWSEASNKKLARKPTRAERNPAELMEMMEKDGHWESKYMRLSRRDRKALGKVSKSRRGAKKFERPSVRALWRASRMQKKPRRWPQQMSHEASELLFSLANCSATEQWVTLDRLFWPRQLLITKCAGPVESFSGVPGGPPPIAQSCGWPPGKLACRNVPLNVNILRWLCMPKATDVMHARIRRTNGTSSAAINPIDKKFYCKWFQVPYTITKDCECSLPKNSNEDF